MSTFPDALLKSPVKPSESQPPWPAVVATHQWVGRGKTDGVRSLESLVASNHEPSACVDLGHTESPRPISYQPGQPCPRSVSISHNGGPRSVILAPQSVNHCPQSVTVILHLCRH